MGKGGSKDGLRDPLSKNTFLFFSSIRRRNILNPYKVQTRTLETQIGPMKDGFSSDTHNRSLLHQNMFKATKAFQTIAPQADPISFDKTSLQGPNFTSLHPYEEIQSQN
jgi:hypothetical protein